MGRSAQGTHEVFLAKQLELSEAGIDIKSKHIFEFYKTVSSNLEGQVGQQVAAEVLSSLKPCCVL